MTAQHKEHDEETLENVREAISEALDTLADAEEAFVKARRTLRNAEVSLELLTEHEEETP